MAKRHAKLFIIVGIAAIVIIVLCVVRQAVLRKVPILPEVDEISEMNAIYYDGEEYNKIEFWVPEQHWERIFDALLPAELDSWPAAWQVLGQLDMKLKNGHPFVVMLFSLKNSPGAFASGETIERRVYYRGGDSAKLRDALRAAYEASQGKKK